MADRQSHSFRQRPPRANLGRSGGSPAGIFGGTALKILIAGSLGQLGSCLNNSLKGHDLVPLDHKALDITQLSSVHEVLGRERPHLVINAAAFNDVDGAESRRNEAYAANACG